MLPLSPTVEDDPENRRPFASPKKSSGSSGSTKYPNTTPRSDSGYSSRSKASTSSSKISAGKTPKASRHPSTVSNSKGSARSADAPKKAADPPPAKSSKPPSRSPSKARPPSPECKDPYCRECRKMPHGAPPPILTTQGHGQWLPPPPVPAPPQPVTSAPSPYPLYGGVPPVSRPPLPDQVTSAPSTLPRPRPRTASSSQPRPNSIAVPQASGKWVFEGESAGHTHRTRPPTVHHPHSESQVITQPPPQPMATAIAPEGMWVRDDPRRPRTTHPEPRPFHTTVIHRPEDVPIRQSHLYGESRVLHSGSTPPRGSGPYAPPPPNYERSRIDMPPPHRRLPPPEEYVTEQYVLRPSPRRASVHDAAARRMSLYEPRELVEIDPEETIRPSRQSVRPSILPYSRGRNRSTAYYHDRSGYPDDIVVLERAVSSTPTYGIPIPRREKIRWHEQQASDYIDATDDQAYYNDTFLDEGMNNMSLEQSPHYSRLGATGHGRSSSRAASSISRRTTDSGAMRFIMDGKTIGISGDTEGQVINVSTGDNGRPSITIGAGPGSPNNARERGYYGEGSQRSRTSRASFADHMRSRDTGSPIEQHFATGNMGRRRSMAGRRQSHDYRR